MVDVNIELTKIREQQQQWHDEFMQREKHWFWQRGFWLVVGSAAVTSTLIAVITFLVKM